MRKHILVLLQFLLVTSVFAQNKISSYEYWFDGDYAGKTVVVVNPVQSFTLDVSIAATELSNGVHTYNIRFLDSSGKWSSTLSHFFYKMMGEINPSGKEIVSYEYWFDNDYSNKITTLVTAQNELLINELLSASHLANGVHTFNIRFKDNSGLWSSPLCQFFYSIPPMEEVERKITAYRYWIDSNFSQAVQLALDPAAQSFNLLDDLDLTTVPKGRHGIHFQFRDNAGLWSSATTDSIEKLSFPLAGFSFLKTVTCDSTRLSFTNTSIDGDEYIWDFGDGTTSADFEPTHTYHTIGSYPISLLTRDTSLLIEDTKSQALDITGSTFSVVNREACLQLVSPSGKYIWKESGGYLDTLLNAAGCDSVITFNLTIKTVDVSVSSQSQTLTANAQSAQYQWLNCDNGFSEISGETAQSFTALENGNYAIRVEQNGCIDTSACLSVTGVGYRSLNSDLSFQVYPNPTQGTVRIDLGSENKLVRVELRDVNSRLLKQVEVRNTGSLDLTIMEPAGVYFLHVFSGDSMQTIKLIKF